MAVAVKAFIPLVVGQELLHIYNDFAGYWRKLIHETQIRWVGLYYVRIYKNLFMKHNE